MYSLVCRYHAGILLVTAVVVYVGILAITVNVVAMPTHAIANFGSFGGGEYWRHLICLSVRLSVCPPVRFSGRYLMRLLTFLAWWLIV